MVERPSTGNTDQGRQWELSWVVRSAVVAVAALNLAVLGGWIVWLIRSSDQGLDPSDEGYYLSAVQSPWALPHAPTEFAFVLRPVWILLGRDVAHYRLFGIAVLLGSAALLGWLAARRVRGGRQIDKLAMSALFASTTAVAALSAIDTGIITPNYNTLTASLLMLFFATVATWFDAEPAPTVHQDRSTLYRQWVFAMATGFVCYLLLIVKLTAGAVASLVLVAAIVYRRRTDRRTWGLVRAIAAGAVIGVLFHIGLVGGRLPERVAAWRTAAELSGLRRDRSRGDIWQWELLSSEAGPILLEVAVLVVGTYVIIRLRRRSPIAEVVAAAGVVGLVFALSTDLPRGGGAGLDATTGLWWIRVAATLMVASLVVGERVRQSVIVGAVVLLAVLGSAFGSNNGFITQTHFFGGALVGGALLMRGQVKLDVSSAEQFMRIAPILACAVLVAVGAHHALGDGRDSPYRLEGARAEAESIVVSGPAASLRLHPGMEELASWLERVAAEWEIVPACIVNLEGGSPVIEFLLGVPPAGSTWDLGAYPGSDAAAAAALGRDDCWMSSDFLLVSSPDARRRIEVPPAIAVRCQRPQWTLDWDGATGRRTLHVSECPLG